MALLWVALLCACGPEPAEVAQREARDARYEEAERAFARGQDAEALERFGVLSREGEDAWVRALALYRVGGVHERAGRWAEARAAYQAVIRSGVIERAAMAELRLALMEQPERDPAAVPARLRALVERWPDSHAADQAVAWLAQRASLAELAWFEASAEGLADTPVGDNLRWWSAKARVRMGDLAGARADLRALVQRWPRSPLLDDALWLLAELYTWLGDYARAATTLRALMAARNEASWVVGTYRSERLDDAALRVAQLDYARGADESASEACEWLLAQFPTSVLRDDAWWLLAHARGRAAPAEAREALRALLDEAPHSRHREAARGQLERLDPMPRDGALPPVTLAGH